jgi:hypothetical protein
LALIGGSLDLDTDLDYDLACSLREVAARFQASDADRIAAWVG